MKTNLELARECGAEEVRHGHFLRDAIKPKWIKTDSTYDFTPDQLDAFAERVRASERERCALVAETGFRFAKDGYAIADDIHGKGNP